MRRFIERVVERWATPLLLIAIRVSWIWPALEIGRRWLTPSYAERWLSLWAVLGLMAGALVTARLVLAVSKRLLMARAMAAVIGLLAVTVVIWIQYAAMSYALWDVAWLQVLGRQVIGWVAELPAPLLATIVAVSIWLRGLLDGSRTLPHDRVWSAFISGFVVFCVVLLAGYYDSRGIPAGAESWLLLLFGAGMGGLALSGMEQAHYGRKPQEGARLRIDRYWLASVASVVGGLLGIGLLVGALVSPGIVARVLGWMGVVLRYAGMVIEYILFALAYVIFRLLTPLIEWLQTRFGMTEWMQNTQEMQQAPEFFEEGEPGAILALAPEYAALLRWLGGIGIVLLVALVFALALRRMQPDEEDFVEEVRDSVFSRDLVAEQIDRLWRSLWPGRADAAEASPYLSLDDEPPGRRAVRALYQRLLETARVAGLPRQPMQTPDEYGPALAERIRAMASLTLVDEKMGEALNRLTVLYDAVRYGDVEPDAGDVAAAEAALTEVEAQLLDQGSDQGQRDGRQK